LEGVSADGLAFLRAGFRARYIEDCVSKLCSGLLSLDAVAELPSVSAKKALMSVKGVGPKVADCALLYGFYRLDCFPEDVWIKKATERFYPDGLPDFIKPYAGIAQQYLFHYMRTGVKG
jgi:N-glycosylase/DNA lyase